MSNYQKFQNPPAYNVETGPNGDPPAYPFQPQAAVPMVNSNVQPMAPFIQQPAKKELKSLNSLRRLIWVELILSMIMILFESIIDGVTSTSHLLIYRPGPCALGTGIWVGVLGLITAGLGWGAFRNQFGNKCMMVAHFVMCIISAVADGVMIIFAGICLGTLPYYTRGTYEFNPELRHSVFRDASADLVALGRGLTAAESFLLVAAIVHFVSSIVSTGYICRNWCQESQPPVSVVYYPMGMNQQQPTVGTDSDPCRIAVPSGAHVIFVPVGQAVPPGIVPQQPPQPDFRNL